MSEVTLYGGGGGEKPCGEGRSRNLAPWPPGKGKRLRRFEPSLDALRLRSDVRSPIRILSPLEREGEGRRGSAKNIEREAEEVGGRVRGRERVRERVSVKEWDRGCGRGRWRAGGGEAWCAAARRRCCSAILPRSPSSAAVARTCAVFTFLRHYRGYSKSRTHTALGSYGSSTSGSKGPS